jgi:hypothetical protein
MSKPPFARILKMGLQTLLGLKRQGFFIPYRYANQLKSAGTRTKSTRARKSKLPIIGEPERISTESLL